MQGSSADVCNRPCPGCSWSNVRDEDELNGWVRLRCGRCGLIYTRDLPAIEEAQHVYEDAYKPGGMYGILVNQLEEMVRTGRSPQGFYRNWIFLKRYKPRPGDKLLDIGCGLGTFLVAAKQMGWDPEGIDISSAALAASAEIHKLPVRCGTLESLDLQSGTYKAIVCWEVLQLLPSPGEFLCRVRKLLRPDGLFVCSVSNNSERVPRLVPNTGKAGLPPVNLNFWTRDSFRGFASLNGFRPLCITSKRSLFDLSGRHDHPLLFLWNQLGAILGLREGMTIYAVLAPSTTVSI